jgi:hypothetical protein
MLACYTHFSARGDVYARQQLAINLANLLLEHTVYNRGCVGNVGSAGENGDDSNR